MAGRCFFPIMRAAFWAVSRPASRSSAVLRSSRRRRSSPPGAPLIAMVPRPTSAPKGGTTLVSAFVRCRSARRWWHASSPTTIYVSAGKSAKRRYGRSPVPEWSEPDVLGNHQRVELVLAAFAAGGIVVVSDDDDRENEGDLFVAASLCTPEKMAFIIRYTSGIVCAPLSPEEARRLHLDPMVAANDAPLGTAFTVSVDFRHGLTTGISAEERSNTVRALANGNAGASDFVRSGHTEACVDLCRLAGLPPVGVLAELMNDDGTVMRGPAVTAFAERHHLKQISIADLIAYRQARDKLVKRIGEFPVQSEIGTLAGYAYVTPFDAIQHMAFAYGRIGDGKNILARLHRADIIRDVFGGAHPIQSSLQRFKQEGRGVIVFLRDGAAGVPTHAIPQAGSTGSEVARSRQWREVGLGAQILKDLGITSIRLLTSAKLTYVGLAGFGIEIVSTESIDDRTPRE